MSKLVSTNRIDYRYYMWIRKMWGLTSTPEARSLCPYFHTMLWGSIFCVICAPFFPIGWLFMKAARLISQIEMPIVERFFNYMDNKTEWMTSLDDAPERMEESPIWNGLAYTVVGLAVLAIAVVIVGSVGMLLGLGGMAIWNFVDIVVCIFDSIAWGFAQIFFIFYGSGWVFHQIYVETIWLFTNGPLWTTIGTWAIWIVSWLLVFGAGSIALCVTCMGIAKTSLVKRLGKFISNKLNGYSEAQKARRTRAEEALKKLPPWKCAYCNYQNLATYKRCDHCEEKKRVKEVVEKKDNYHTATATATATPWYIYPFIPIFWVMEKIFKYYIKIKDQELFSIKDIVGVFALLWSYIVALKKGVCPLLEFVDPEELQTRKQASAKARMDRENESEKNDSTE